MARKMYRSEEKRLDRIETNRLLRRRLDNATFWFASAEVSSNVWNESEEDDDTETD